MFNVNPTEIATTVPYAAYSASQKPPTAAEGKSAKDLEGGYQATTSTSLQLPVYSEFVADASIELRMGFLRKVYVILLSQLAITCGQIAMVMFIPGAQAVFREHFLAIWLSTLLASIVLLIVLKFVEQKFPLNILLLYTWTIVFGFSIATICSAYNVWVVLEAIGITALITVIMTVYTLQTKKDFSFLGMGLMCGLMILVFAGIIQLVLSLLGIGRWFFFFYAAGGALLFTLFILYDTSRLIHDCHPDEYVSASINLYLDIINLFLYVLALVGVGSRR